MVQVITTPRTVRRKTVVTRSVPAETVVTNTNAVPHRSEMPKKVAIFRTYQVIWYILGVIETLLIFRFIFRLTGASTVSPFVQLIYGLTAPLIAPFRGIYGTVNVVGSYFESVTLLAMVIYLILAWAIIYLFQLLKPVNEAEVEQTVDNV